MRDQRGSYFMKWDVATQSHGHDLVKARQSFEQDATVVDGIVRWNSNGTIPPVGILQHWQDLGLPFNFAASVATQEKETAAFFAEYRKNQKPASAEERYEMRAAFGPGVDVVDVLSGRRTRT